MKQEESRMKASQIHPGQSQGNGSVSKLCSVVVEDDKSGRALTFNQFLHSLPKETSVEQTRVWLVECSELLDKNDSSLDQEQTLLAFSFHDCCSITEPDESRRSFEGIRFKNIATGSIEKESYSSGQLNNDGEGAANRMQTQQKPSQDRVFLEEKSPLLGPSQCRLNSASEHGPSSSSSGSSCCYFNSDVFYKEQNEFACGWNTCDYKELSVDKIFHHILHSHLHRTTNFRSSRCLWRGCSRDGIVKSFSNRHQLLIHVGIHCQRLKEPNSVSTYLYI